jgi:adenylate cyclase
VSADDPAPTDPDGTPERLYEQIERSVLGSARTLTRLDVAEQAGVPLERAIALWQALGFSATQDDEAVVFVEADVEALRMVSWLIDSGFIDPDDELTLVRTMGRSLARMAEWEIAELAASKLTGTVIAEAPQLEEMIGSLLPVVEDVQNYVWRRHLANAAGRMLLRPGGDGGVEMTVGFADIVGFTRRSRGLSSSEITRLVETFEAVSARVVTENHGRVIKTIGDEVLFVADDPVEGARIALALVEIEEEDFPEVRVGLAHGPVVSRLGDVFGPVVNIASRLTTIARPGRVLIDRELHDVLKPMTEEFRVRRGRTTAVKGYTRLDTWTLNRPRPGRF